MIVREPKEEDVHGKLYDYDLTDHIIFAQEFFHNVTFLLPTVPQIPELVKTQLEPMRTHVPYVKLSALSI